MARKKKPLQRTQFMMFDSFVQQFCLLGDNALKGIAYETLCFYALYGIEPDISAMPREIQLVLPTILAVAKSGRDKAIAGSKGGSVKQGSSRGQAEDKQTPTNRSKKENRKEEENENKNMNKNENTEIEESRLGAAGCVCSELPYSEIFELFWDTYPIQVDREGAMDAWRQIDPDEQTARGILDSLDEWMETNQWHNENGRYIPHPAAFLSRGYWQNAPGALPLPDYIPELRRRF